MARYTGAKCRMCRRADMKLFLKGVRCITEKCAFAKRPFPPGPHGQRRGKPTNYAIQLREKQKLKRMYGMLEKQFRRFFAIANRAKGVTGRNLIQLLERRIDNVIYRALFASSRDQARQLVRHGSIKVDGKKVDIPSYIIKQGQTIELQANDSYKQYVKGNIEQIAKDRSSPTWMQVDNDNLKVDIVRVPEKEDLTIAVDEQLIVELYSK